MDAQIPCTLNKKIDNYEEFNARLNLVHLMLFLINI